MPELVATCWTSAGGAVPGAADQRSTFTLEDRVREVAQTGWVGMGLVADDLVAGRDTIGFDGLRALLQDNGLHHIEVELVQDWWLPGFEDGQTDAGRRTELLLEAAAALGAPFIKVGPGIGPAVDDIGPLVAPLRRLAERAAAVGTRVALEPLPFAHIASMPQGAELVRAVDHPACGLAVDYWHVFRANTSLTELAACLSPEIVVAVELCDADREMQGTELFADTRDHRRYCGEGDQDVAGFIRTMREVGFGGPWGVEILSIEHRALPLRDALIRARDTALACFDEASAPRT